MHILEKKEDSKINHLSFHFSKQEKEELLKYKVKRKEEIRIKSEYMKLNTGNH